MLTVEPKRFRPVLMIFLIAVVAACCLDCFSSRVVFEPVKEERPVHLLGRYTLDILGFAEESYNFRCRVSFLGGHPDTMHIDTIPVLVIDSVCFEGRCLDKPRCYRLESHHEWILELQKQGYFRNYKPDPSKYWQSLLQADYILKPSIWRKGCNSWQTVPNET